MDSLLLLKLVSILYPTSDFKHPVVTPALLYMSNILTQCAVTCIQDVYSGLFVCNLILEYVSLSKRFVPEAINFLRGVLFLACPADPNKIEPVVPPFKPVGPHCGLLSLHSKHARDVSVKNVPLSRIFTQKARPTLDTDSHRVSCLHQCLYLLNEFSTLYTSLPAYAEIFSPIMYFCDKLSIKKYPSVVQELHIKLSEQVSSHSGQQRAWLCRKRQKPAVFKALEPKLEENFDGRRKRVGSKEKQVEARLQHRYKREMKGAVRDIKKDAQFLAAHRLQTQMQRDAERKRKVREIYGQLATQEGDVKALKRKKDSG